MLGSRGRGSTTMRVCFGYLALPGGSGQGSNPVLQIIWTCSAMSLPVPASVQGRPSTVAAWMSAGAEVSVPLTSRLP